MLESAGHAPKQYESPEIKNRDRNKLLHSDRQFHDWYRFILSFPPQLVRDYIRKFDLQPGKDVILDPFCGTATTLVESKFEKITSIGFEANKFAQFAGSIKVNWSVDGALLLETAQKIYGRVQKRLARIGISDLTDCSEIENSLLKDLTPDKRALILTDSISPVPLHKVLVLLEEIEQFARTEIYGSLCLALANTVVFKSSNLRFGPEVGIGKLKKDAAVIEPWFEQVSQMSRDLIAVDGHLLADANVIATDARNFAGHLRPSSISAVITSPPYPNEKDYTRTTRLESVLLGFVSSKEELRAMKKTLLRSNTRGIYKEDDDDQFVKHIPQVEEIAEQIEAERIRRGKTSGFERAYARVTKLYFGGMAKHLKELQPFLKKGSQLGYVVGDQASYLQVMIPTGHILADIAVSLGYELETIDVFRTRFSTATKSDLNEEVVVLRWPGPKKG